MRERPSLVARLARLAVPAWLVVVLGGVGCLVAAMVPVGPDLLPGIGAVAVAGAFTWALAARTGFRVTSDHLVLEGSCPTCQARERT